MESRHRPSSPAAAPHGAAVEPPPPTVTAGRAAQWWARFGSPPRRPLLMGFIGSVLLVIGGLGGGWVLLGREVIARRVGGRVVLSTAAVWLLPMLVSPPLFTRDAYSYLAQGALP